jgi:hypothetical protein
MKIEQNEGASSKCWASNRQWVGLKALSKILEKMSKLTTFSNFFQAPSTLKKNHKHEDQKNEGKL